MPRHRNLLMTVALLAAIVGCEEEPAGNARGGWGGAAQVVTHQVELQPLVDEIQALGTAHANESIDIQPRIASLIERLASAARRRDLIASLSQVAFQAFERKQIVIHHKYLRCH